MLDGIYQGRERERARVECKCLCGRRGNTPVKVNRCACLSGRGDLERTIKYKHKTVHFICASSFVLAVILYLGYIHTTHTDDLRQQKTSKHALNVQPL